MSSWIYVPEPNSKTETSSVVNDSDIDDNNYDDGCDFTIYNIPFGVFSLPMIKKNDDNKTTTKTVVTTTKSTSEGGTTTRTTETTTTTTSSPPSSKQQHYDQTRCCTRIGNTIIDLSILEECQVFAHIDGLKSNTFNQSTLNKFISHNQSIWIDVRKCLQEILICNPINNILYNNHIMKSKALYHINHVKIHIPIHIGDYTDFYASMNHAINVGTMFRGVDNALPMNYKYIPIGYHGRSSTIYPSHTNIHRPRGQILKSPSSVPPTPTYDVTHKLDYEMEIGAILGGNIIHDNDDDHIDNDNINNDIHNENQYINQYPISMNDAKQCIFGYILLNDWSSRDIQQWEYIPLGPFTSKNFATSISLFIITKISFDGGIHNNIDSLSKYTCQYIKSSKDMQSQEHTISTTNNNDPIPFPYLQDTNSSDNENDPNHSSTSMSLYDIQLTVSIQTNTQLDATSPKKTSSSSNDNNNTTTLLTKTNTKYLYWNTAQQIAHHTVTGCRMRVGDVLGSGTISGTTEDSKGSLLELSYNGTKPILLNDNTTRTFLQDNDTIIMKGYCYGKPIKTETTTTNESKHTDNNTMIRIGFGSCIGTILPPVPLSLIQSSSTTTNETTTTSMIDTPVKATTISNTTTTNIPKTTSIKKPIERYQRFILYGHDKSSLMWSVRIALNVKRISYKMISSINEIPNEYEGRAEYMKNNLLGHVPLLQYTDTYTNQILYVSQPMAIITLLDNIYQSDRYSLIPSSSIQIISLAFQIVEMTNTNMPSEEDLMLLLLRKEDNDWSQQRDGQSFSTMENQMKAGLAMIEHVVRSIHNKNNTVNDSYHSMMDDNNINYVTAVTTVSSSHDDNNGTGCCLYCLGTLAPTIVDVYIIPKLHHAKCMYSISDLETICPTLLQIKSLCYQQHPLWFEPELHPEYEYFLTFIYG